MNNYIKHPIISESRTIIRSGKVINNTELVVVAGYTDDGKFGYFVTHEKILPNEFEYINTLKFIVRENEKSYSQILEIFKELVV